MPTSARYYAHSDTDHGRLLEACSFVDAALAFAEAHAPTAEEEAVRVVVQAEHGGPEHCFLIHLHDGAVEPCG